MPLQPSKKPFIGRRWLVILLLCYCVTVVNMMRANLGIAMVCMVSVNGSEHLYELSNSSDCTINSAHHYNGKFEWSSQVQSLIFSATFWGAAITSLPAGWFSDKYGPKSVLFACTFVSLISTVLSPVAAQLHYSALIAVRFVGGLAQGLLIGGMASTVAQWVKPTERTKAMALQSAGQQIALIIGPPIYTQFCITQQVFDGWPLIFYFTAALSAIWCVIWIGCFANSPAQCRSRWMSANELQELQASLSQQSLLPITGQSSAVPWRSILLSKPMWACNLSNIGMGVANSTFFTYLPTYFRDVLRLDIQTNGIYSAAPFLCQLCAKLIFTVASDFIRSRNYASKNTTTRIFNSIACFGQAAFLIACSYLSCVQATTALILLCSAVICSQGFVPGFQTSVVSIAPRYSGIARSLSGMFSQIAGCVAPYLIGFVTKNGRRDEWQFVFYGLAIVLIIAGVFYAAFGSVDIQRWATVNPLIHNESCTTIISDVETPEAAQNNDLPKN